MTFGAAIRTCLAKYVTFSGRASRSEYWWFFLFTILGRLVAGVLDSLLFGDSRMTTEAQPDVLGVIAPGVGPVALFYSLILLPAALAAGWRRMHDSGRSGLYLLYPLVAIVGFSGLYATIEGIGLGGENLGNWGVIAILIDGAAVAMVLAPLLVFWWLTRPSQPGPNRYGPNPYEVTP